MSPVNKLKKRKKRGRQFSGFDPKIGYDLHYNDDISTDYEGMFSTEMYSERAKSIIKEHNKSRPLFMMVSFQAPHNPFQTPPSKFTSQYSNSTIPTKERNRAATVTALDEAVGEIVASLKEEGLYHNSVILFSSDNGGAGAKYNYPLRGKKEFMYEGGVRVVSLVSSPLVTAPGSVYPGMVHVTDWFSSILHLAGLGDQIPGDTSSVNVFPAIIAMSPSPRSRIIHNIDEDKGKGSWQAVVRDGDFKLIWGQAKLLDKKRRKRRFAVNQKTSLKLFNIAEDPNERSELSQAEYADVIKRLKGILLEEYKITKFPSYHTNIARAFPKNNSGYFVTGWC